MCSTNVAGRTKEANERCFVFVHPRGRKREDPGNEVATHMAAMT